MVDTGPSRANSRPGNEVVSTDRHGVIRRIGHVELDGDPALVVDFAQAPDESLEVNQPLTELAERRQSAEMTRIGVGLQVPADGQVLQMNVANTVGVALDEAYGVDPGTKQVGGVRAEHKYLALVHYGHDLGLVLDLTPEVGMQARLDAENPRNDGPPRPSPAPARSCRPVDVGG